MRRMVETKVALRSDEQLTGHTIVDVSFVFSLTSSVVSSWSTVPTCSAWPPWLWAFT